MADDKLKTGLEEQQVPESPGPAEPGGSPTPEQPAPEHPGPEAPQEENTPAAPSGKVIDLTEARAAGEKTAEGPAVEEGSPKHGDEAFRDLFGNEEKPPWEKSLDEIKEEENAHQRGHSGRAAAVRCACRGSAAHRPGRAGALPQNGRGVLWLSGTFYRRRPAGLPARLHLAGAAAAHRRLL